MTSNGEEIAFNEYTKGDSPPDWQASPMTVQAPRRQLKYEKVFALVTLTEIIIILMIRFVALED